MTPERKAELLTFADEVGAGSWIGATVVELINEIIKLELDIIETRGNYDARAQIADRDRSIEALTARTSELLGKVAALESDLAIEHNKVDTLQVQLEGRRLIAADKDRQVASLQAQHDADAARIAGLEAAANRRIVERDARIDEVAAEAQEERAKRDAAEARIVTIETAAREMLTLCRSGSLIAVCEWDRVIAARKALEAALAGAQ